MSKDSIRYTATITIETCPSGVHYTPGQHEHCSITLGGTRDAVYAMLCEIGETVQRGAHDTLLHAAADNGD